MTEEKHHPNHKHDGSGTETELPEKTPVQEIVDEILEGLPEWLREPLSQNFRQIFAGIACALVAAALWSGYTGYVERGEDLASASLGTALHTSDPAERMNLLEKVISEHGRTDAAEHALLLLGAAARDAGDMKKASEYFSRALSEFDSGSVLHDSALMGLGYIREEQGENSDAAEKFSKVADDATGYEAVALLDLARVSAASGDRSGALAAYERFMAAEPMSPELDFVRFEIMKLSATDNAVSGEEKSSKEESAS